MVFNSNWGPIFTGMKISKFSIDLDLTFEGHPMSKVMVPKGRLYINYYKCSIVTMVLI